MEGFTREIKKWFHQRFVNIPIRLSKVLEFSQNARKIVS